MLYLHIADQVVHPNRETIRDPMTTFYIGESFSLTYVINDVLAPFLSQNPSHTHNPSHNNQQQQQQPRSRLYFPIAQGFDPSDKGRRDIVAGQRRLLRQRHLLHTLELPCLDKLLATYFRWFHPCFPIVTRSDFLDKCASNQQSLLVLNAVLLVAVTICDAQDLPLTGCETRYLARETFYRQAKTLYDADSDPDKVNNIVAVFLMSFWWGGSNDEKDSWHWLGIAINLAQSLGMHRS
jgi:hypothetical protein